MLQGNTHNQRGTCPCGYVPLATRRDQAKAKEEAKNPDQAITSAGNYKLR